MTKTKNNTNKKGTWVLERTKELNDIVKKREQEPKSVSKVTEVNVDMLLDAIPNAKVNKRKGGLMIITYESYSARSVLNGSFTSIYMTNMGL